MHQILWLLYIAIIWYKKSTSLPKLYDKKKMKTARKWFSLPTTNKKVSNKKVYQN